MLITIPTYAQRGSAPDEELFNKGPISPLGQEWMVNTAEVKAAVIDINNEVCSGKMSF